MKLDVKDLFLIARSLDRDARFVELLPGSDAKPEAKRLRELAEQLRAVAESAPQSGPPRENPR